MKRERKEFTERYVIAHDSIEVPLICTCRSFSYPHELEAHTKLKSGHDWAIRAL